MKHNNNDPGPPLVKGDGVMFSAMVMTACLAIGFAVVVFSVVQQWLGGGQ